MATKPNSAHCATLMLLASVRLPARQRPPCTEMIAGFSRRPVGIGEVGEQRRALDAAVDDVGPGDDRRARLRQGRRDDERGQQRRGGQGSHGRIEEPEKTTAGRVARTSRRVVDVSGRVGRLFRAAKAELKLRPSCASADLAAGHHDVRAALPAPMIHAPPILLLSGKPSEAAVAPGTATVMCTRPVASSLPLNVQNTDPNSGLMREPSFSAAAIAALRLSRSGSISNFLFCFTRSRLALLVHCTETGCSVGWPDWS